MNNIKTFFDHLVEENRQNNALPPSDRNILAPCTDAQMALNALVECFLGDDWYVAYPASNGQVNTEATCEILGKYSRKFRRLVKDEIKKERLK